LLLIIDVKDSLTVDDVAGQLLFHLPQLFLRKVNGFSLPPFFPAHINHESHEEAEGAQESEVAHVAQAQIVKDSVVVVVVVAAAAAAAAGYNIAESNAIF